MVTLPLVCGILYIQLNYCTHFYGISGHKIAKNQALQYTRDVNFL
jgi:hypothetical protein